MAFVCPITSRVRGWPFEVALPPGLLPAKRGREDGGQGQGTTAHSGRLFALCPRCPLWFILPPQPRQPQPRRKSDSPPPLPHPLDSAGIAVESVDQEEVLVTLIKA